MSTANIGQIRDLFQQIEKVVQSSSGDSVPLKAIIIDARSIPSIDSRSRFPSPLLLFMRLTLLIAFYSAIKLLRDLTASFKQKNITLCFVKLQDNNKKKMLRSGIIGTIGSDKFFSSIKDAVSFVQGDVHASFSTYRDIM